MNTSDEFTIKDISVEPCRSSYFGIDLILYHLTLNNGTILFKPYDGDNGKHINTLQKAICKKRSELKDKVKKFKKLEEKNNGNSLKNEWREFYNNKKELDAPIGDAYAITIHKSQGSTYNKIYVHIEDINKNWIDFIKNRLLYTAVSRGKTKIFLYFNEDELKKICM